MQKTITKVLILGILLTAALGVNYLFAAWTGPTQAPTGGNTSTPVHVGTTDQVKNGGLSVDALSVFGSGYFQGNVGVGVVTPTEALDVDGGVRVGNSTNANAGTIRWTGTDFEGFNGTQWVSMTGDDVPADPNYTNCVNAGGSWVDAQNTCYFPTTSCPSGWSSNANYSSITGKTCGPGCPGLSEPYKCSIPTHYRQNSGNTCNYFPSEGTFNSCLVMNQSKHRQTCTAQISEIGCTKN